MYACMHACMHVCTHACMYACMHVCMHAHAHKAFRDRHLCAAATPASWQGPGFKLHAARCMMNVCVCVCVSTAALKVPNMLPPAAAAAAAAALDSRQAQMELDEHEGGSNETWTDEEVFAAVPLFPCITQPRMFSGSHRDTCACQPARPHFLPPTLSHPLPNTRSWDCRWMK